MRTDTNLARSSFRFSDEWRRPTQGAQLDANIDRRLQGGQLEDGRYVVHSLSGNERNHFFINRAGKRFDDLSPLSGIDNPADGRGFALLDYDHDGWQDIAIVNANKPLFNLYRNQMSKSSGKRPYQVIAIRFVGGSSANNASGSTFACRDGYGAQVTAQWRDLKIKREHRCGEGFGVQNSRTMILGIGERKTVPSLTVRWPSGKSIIANNVAAGTLLTVYENKTSSPVGGHFVRSNYHNIKSANQPAPTRKPTQKFSLESRSHANGVRVYTTMATWCVACKSHLPQLRTIKTLLKNEGIEIIGVPIDKNDDVQKLNAYTNKYQPPYRMITQLSDEKRTFIARFLATELDGETPLPSTVITDASGNVLDVLAGVPDVSRIRKVVASSGQKSPRN